MTTLGEILDIFNKAFNGQKNFMTPNIVRYGKVEPSTSFVGNRYFELSYGSGFSGEKIYGVTVIDVLQGEIKKRHDLSTGGFRKLSDAEYYIEHELNQKS